MPRVGDEEFAYTPEGEEAAERKSLETGEPVIPTYDAGGRVEKIKGYAHGGLVRPINPVSPMNPVSPIANEGIVTPDVSPIMPSPQPGLYKKGGKVKKK